VVDSAPTAVKSGWLPYVSPGKNSKSPLGAVSVWTGCLVVLFLLIVVTLIVVVPRIESRLEQQTKVRLEQAGIDSSLLSFSWNYRDLSVHGELPPGVEMDQLATALNPTNDAGRTWFARGVRHLRLHVSEPRAPVQPVTINQRLKVRFLTDGNSATLDGMVQTLAQRERLVNAALQAGVETINDNLDVIDANKSSDGGDVKVDALARMLEISGPQQVAIGQASLSTENLTYRFTARDRDSAKEIEQASSLAMIDFVVIGEMDYVKHGVVEALAVGEGNEIRLSGTVLSDSQAKRLRFAADEAVGSANVIDVLTVSDEEPKIIGADKRVEIMANAVALFQPGYSATIQLAGKDLAVDATVNNDADRRALIDALNDVDGSAKSDNTLTIDDKIRVVNADENNRVDLLQQQLDAYTQEIRKTVVFSTGENTLGRRARETLDQIALSIKDNLDLRIEVEGHTDNVGRASVNDELSQQRANAVRDYLIKQSVPAESLVAVGYGQRQPLATNDTSEGRRLNRRVHFRVLEGTEN